MSDNKNQALFSVIFKDGTCYVGGTSDFHTKWLDMPNKPIKRVFYKLPDGNHLCLEGYDKYNRMVEATKDWMKVGPQGMTKLSNDPVIEYIYFMGQKDGMVISYRIAMLEGTPGRDKFRRGDVTRREYELGKEWNGKPTTGWK